MLDDISVFPTSRCQNAVIQSIVVGAEEATIESVSNGDFENFEVVVSTQPITDWATVDQSTFVFHQLTDETEVFVSGLAQNTMYYVYVRTHCADNESGYTDWVSAQFKTKVRVALPYAQDFNTTDALNTQGDLGMVAGWSWGNDLDDERTLPYVYSGTFTTNFYSCSIDSTQYVAFVGVDNTNLAAIEAGKKAYIATPELTGNLQSYEVDFWATPYKFFSNGKDEYAAELTVGVVQLIESGTADTAVGLHLKADEVGGGQLGRLAVRPLDRSEPQVGIGKDRADLTARIHPRTQVGKQFFTVIGKCVGLVTKRRFDGTAVLGKLPVLLHPLLHRCGIQLQKIRCNEVGSGTRFVRQIDDLT